MSAKKESTNRVPRTEALVECLECELKLSAENGSLSWVLKNGSLSWEQRMGAKLSAENGSCLSWVPRMGA